MTGTLVTYDTYSDSAAAYTRVIFSKLRRMVCQHMRPKECVSEAKYFLAPHAITKDMCQAQTNADFDSCATYEYAAHINVQPLYSTHYLSPVALAAAATVDEPTGQLET